MARVRSNSQGESAAVADEIKTKREQFQRAQTQNLLKLWLQVWVTKMSHTNEIFANYFTAYFFNPNNFFKLFKYILQDC